MYRERNGQDGYQLPSDWRNPQDNEDMIVTSQVSEIIVEEKSVTQEIKLSKGVNIVSFSFMLIGENNKPITAKQLLALYPNDLSGISSFSSGRWSDTIVIDNEGNIKGQDFPFVMGHGYLLTAKNDTSLSLPAFLLKSSVPIYFLPVWNLVGVHGYSEAYS